MVDLVSMSQVHVGMAFEHKLGKKLACRRLAEERNRTLPLRKAVLFFPLLISFQVFMHRDVAILSLVRSRKQTRNMVGITGRMFTALAQGNVNIEIIGQGTSEIGRASCRERVSSPV